MNKKRLLLLLQVGLLSLVVFAQNPISPPGIYIADPSARVMPDGKMYVYGSWDESRNYYCSKKYHVLSSSNLKDWSLSQTSFTSEEGGDDKAILYAPDCIEKKGTYYLYYCMSDNSEGVATSKSPNGPFLKGKSLGVKGIDPAVFVDDDGQAYYYWGQFQAKGAKLNKDMQSINMSTMKDNLVTEEKHHFHEGSWVFKRNGIYYYVYTSLSPKAEATTIAYSTSKSPLGPFTYRGIIIDNTGCDPCSWNDHGSVVQYKGEWYIFYHRSTHACQAMRKACVEKIHFNKDGSIPQVEMTSQGAAGPLDAYSVTDAARACLLTGKMRIVQSATDREELARIENYNLATYKYLKFNHAPKKLIVRAAAQNGGQIQLLTNSFRVLAIVNIPASDGKTYSEYTADVQGIPQGVTQVRFRFMGEEDKDLMRFDSFKFE